MRAKLMLCALAAGVAGSFTLGCQTYDFERVEPLALGQTEKEKLLITRNNKPNLMLLVDTSGSMDEWADSSCTSGSCPTRWSELKGAMSNFLGSSGDVARMGLVTYPAAVAGQNATQCSAASTVRFELPATEASQELVAWSGGIRDALAAMGASATNGGTPTAASLSFVGQIGALQDPERENFVLLLTDGLPNCNENHAEWAASGTCECTSSSCSTATQCLDDDASVAAVRSLLDKGIKTIVVGFGADTASSLGATTLQGMAAAGGFARSCKDDPGACGAGDTCDPVTELCGRKFYQAANQAELGVALAAISAEIIGEPCFFEFLPEQMPSDPRFIAVYVGEEDEEEPVALPAGSDTWRLEGVSPDGTITGDTGVRFLGSTCARIESATPTNPVKVSIRALQAR